MDCKWSTIGSLLSVMLIFSCGPSLPKEIIAEMDHIPSTIDYSLHVKPLLSDRCFKCHGPDANKREGELRLDVQEDAFKKVVNPVGSGKYVIKPKNLKNSEFYHRIVSEEVDYMMPPPESHLTLTDREKAILIAWIEQGAEYKDHWAFATPEKPQLPKVISDWASNEIDLFIREKQQYHDLQPSETAEDHILLRRAYLDLLGLPPSADEVTKYLSDASPDKFEKLIDQLLERPEYGERMALEWLDVSRYADSHGYQDDGLRNTYPYRDWLIRAFNDNLPYDDFITWQLAGDLLENPTTDQLIATCFNRNHPQTQEGGIVDEEYRVEYVADRANTIGKGLMGLTMECARCHDHKYDPISQKDYFSLFAFFNNNNESGIVPYNGEASPTLLLPTAEAKKELQELHTTIDSLEKLLDISNYHDEFEKWYASIDGDEISINQKRLADFHFDKEVSVLPSSMNLDRKKDIKKSTTEKIAYVNSAKSKPDATINGDYDQRPDLVEGRTDQALHFKGDAGVRFNRDLDLDRHQPFSVSLWIKPLQDSLEGPVYGNTNGDFEGYRGWLCKYDERGKLAFQFNHVWPNNSIDIQTDIRPPANEWTHIAMSYDGSSRADGVDIYINGKVPELTIITDNLYKSLLYGKNKTNWSNLPFGLGIELRKTIKDIVMDDLLIYDRQLSAIEIKALAENKRTIPTSDKKELTGHYLYAGYDPVYNERLQKITEVRDLENQLLTDQDEIMIMQERSVTRETFLLDRGVYDQPADPVEPAIPASLDFDPSLKIESRLDFAHWLTHPDHPLTSRVAVNRIWKMLFGKGLVATQEDFGNQGNLPSHPELLDYLALRYIEKGWDTKELIIYIMSSSTYRQSSQSTEDMAEKDPENLWYARYPAHRLAGEMIRDHALASSGLLHREIGGPSVYPYQPPGLWKALATRNATQYEQQHGDSLYRRSMYTVWKRSSPPPSMMTFDAPDRYYCVVDRQQTSTPLQSLILLNDVQFLEASRVLAQEMMTQGNYDPIEYAFLSLIGRKPDKIEKDLLKEQLEKAKEDLQYDSEAVAAWLDAGEYPIAKDLNRVDLAANSMVASTIMNFDEFVMKR